MVGGREGGDLTKSLLELTYFYLKGASNYQIRHNFHRCGLAEICQGKKYSKYHPPPPTYPEVNTY